MALQVRRGTAAEWIAANPVLLDGEPGFEKDTGVFKIGDGVTAWTSLPSYSSANTLLESRGAAVDQTAARTLEDRWLAFIRDAGSGAPSHPSFNYLGGDVTDLLVDGTAGLWVGADWFDGTTVDADDTYAGDALPVRNGTVLESVIGTFTQQIYHAGTSGVWLDAVAAGGLAAGTHWWPVAALNDGGTRRVFCWHVDPTVGPWGGLLDSHIVTLNAFLGYASHVVTNLGGITDNFWVDGAFRDTTHTFIYGEQFVPDYDVDVDNDGSPPNYGRGDITTHHTLKRVARVLNGQLTTFANWEFWNGSGWVSGAANATPMVDTDGVPIRGDTGIKKITDGHYIAGSHTLVDTHLTVYRSTAPQGPWEAFSRIFLPTQGSIINGGRQIGQLTKVLHSAVNPAGTPAEHSIALVSRNLLDPVDAFAIRNIRRYAPQFAVVPHY